MLCLLCLLYFILLLATYMVLVVLYTRMHASFLGCSRITGYCLLMQYHMITEPKFWNSLSLDADGMNSTKSTNWTSTYVSRWKSVLNSLADHVSQVRSYFLSTRSLISFLFSIGFYEAGKLCANMEVIVWLNLCEL